MQVTACGCSSNRSGSRERPSSAMSSERRKPPPHSFRPSSAAGRAAKPQQQTELKGKAGARQRMAARGSRARKLSVTPQEIEAMTRALDSLDADWDEFKAHQPVARRLSVLVSSPLDLAQVSCLSG